MNLADRIDSGRLLASRSGHRRVHGLDKTAEVVKIAQEFARFFDGQCDEETEFYDVWNSFRSREEALLRLTFAVRILVRFPSDRFLTVRFQVLLFFLDAVTVPPRNRGRVTYFPGAYGDKTIWTLQ